MFCWNCGTQIAQEVSFCPKCGKQQKQGEPVSEPLELRVEELLWETCEIVYQEQNHPLLGAIFWFEAEAIGPSGKYTATKSKPVVCGSRFSNDPESRNQRTVDGQQEIIKRLVADGWQPIGARGAHWWNDKFRRQVPPDWQDWQDCEIKKAYASGKLFDSRGKFVACLVGRTSTPGKVEILAESAPFKKYTDLRSDESKTKSEVLNVYHGFFDQLLKSGWKPLDTVGDTWFNKQFRRRVTK